MDKILQMLQLQQQLNDATNGEDWEKGNVAIFYNPDHIKRNFT